MLKVAAEMAAEYGVADRLECSRAICSPIRFRRRRRDLGVERLHDWDVRRCQSSSRDWPRRSSGGRLMIHDVFLNDALDGPLPIALYSAALFCVTQGRAYSAAEYRGLADRFRAHA